MFHIELIGVSGDSLSKEQRQLIDSCVLIAHSRRQEDMLAGLGLTKVPITPLNALYEALETGLKKGNVAVLASGDPLFFGIGKNLLAHFGPDCLQIYPALSAIQLACARFKTPWEDLSILSLHGRQPTNLAARILQHERVLCFTDALNSPNTIAQVLKDILTAYGDTERLQGVRLQVGENLGLSSEKLSVGSPDEIAGKTFSPLNMVLVEQPTLPRANLPVFGLSEQEIAHSRGLITKDEIRAATLHHLRLPSEGVFWDIGGGSGSVSLEAARLAPKLDIYTIEKKTEEQENIRHNVRTFAAYSINLISGEAPEALVALPAPDRIFIGGSGKRLVEILHIAANRLRPDGLIVVNAVLESTRDTALTTLKKLGLQVHLTTLALTREVPDQAPQHYNLITILTAT